MKVKKIEIIPNCIKCKFILVSKLIIKFWNYSQYKKVYDWVLFFW